MSSVDYLRGFVSERLTAAAEEIFGVFIKTVVEYEEEIDRQRRLLDICWKPEIKLHRIELPQQHVCTEEVLTDQQLCNQERNSSLDQEDPEPPQIKEEQEELCSSWEGETLVLKQEETDSFMLTPTHEESDHSEPKPNTDFQLLCNNSHVNAQKGNKHGDAESTGNTEPKESHSKSAMSKSHCDFKCDTFGKAFVSQSKLNAHNRSHTELSQQHVCKEEKVFADQQLCIQEKNSSLDQEDPELPQIKEEQEELCTSQEGEQLVLKQETNTFMLTYVESDHSEPKPNTDCQLHFHNFHVAESQDQKGDKHKDPESSRHTEPKPKKRHQKKKSESNFTMSFKCDTCGKAFDCQSKLNAHMRIHTGEKPYYCNTCGKRFSQISTLNVHLRIHTGEKPFNCKTCGRAFRQSSNLSAHVRRAHTDEKPFTCTTCWSTFRKSGDLAVHIRRAHTGEKPYLCKTCGKGFTVMSKLKRHTLIHTGEKPYLCSTCGKTFRDTTVLLRHMRIHTGEKPFTCKTCGKDFRARPELIVHMRIHTGEKPYVCKTCGKDFRFRSTLSIHMRVHTGEKPYTCTTCGRAFTYSGHLTFHMRRAHTGEKPYSCNTCGKRFCQISALNVHLRIHTGEKPFTCKICGRAFRQSSNLSVHMRTHTGEKPYLCNTCGKIFADASDLAQHIKSHTDK